MGEWKEYELGDIAEIIMGQSPKGEECNTENLGFPLLNGPTEFGTKNPTPVQFTEFARRYSNKNDILFCVRGSTTGRMNWADQIYAIGRGLAAIRHKKGAEYKFFIKGLLDLNLPLMLSSTTGSTFPNISKDQLERLKIIAPPLPEQKAIASVLSCLDDKIDLLHCQNKTLEAMAETLFRQWFIEEIQDDWEEYSIADFAHHKKDSVKPSEKGDVDFKHYSIPAYDNDLSPIIEKGKSILSNKYKVHSFSILVSKLNPRFPRIWPIYFDTNKESVCSTEFQVVLPMERGYFGYIFFLLKSSKVRSKLESSASGTSGSHQRIKPEDIFNITFSVPSRKALKEYSTLIKPMLQKVNCNRKNINNLEILRDTLLPKLMNGEVKVEY